MCCWPPVLEVCLNHEVVMFQTRSVTTPKPSLCRLFLYILLLNLPCPPLLPSDVLLGGQPTPDPPPHPHMYALLSHMIIRPIGRHPSLSQNTENTLPTPHPSLSDSNSSSPPSSPPCLTYYHHRCSLADAKISVLHMFFICRLLSPRLPEPPPSLVTHILREYLENRPQSHPLCHCRLPPINVGLERLCPRSLNHSVQLYLPPRSVLLPFHVHSHHLP